jgi:hypothetical protein
MNINKDSKNIPHVDAEKQEKDSTAQVGQSTGQAADSTNCSDSSAVSDDVIDLRDIFAKLWNNKRLYTIVLVASFLFGLLWIMPKPRFYKTNVSLAPEPGSGNSISGSMSSIASSFGIDLGDMQTMDAIYPTLYPDLFATSNFIVSLFDIKITTQDGILTTTYYDYLDKHQKKDPWDIPKGWVSKQINKLMPATINGNRGNTKGGINPFCLTKRQDEIVNKVRNNITCSIDRKTNVITITVEDQDPLICATMADSVRERLQQFITDYRTSKARKDVAYYEGLTRKAKAEYERVRQTYVAYADANTDVVLESFRSKQEDLENEMQLRFNAYTAFNTQLQQARAKLLENMPAFTTIQAASVPIKPAGPKRMFIIIGIMFIAFAFTTVWIIRKDLEQLILPAKK